MTRLAPFLLLITLSIAASHLVAAPTQITPQATPNGGKRARTVTDAAGTVHLIYNQQGNLFYVKKRAQDATFSSPLQVNSIDRSGAVADIAIGKDGSVHTLFHGNIFYMRNQIKAENRKLKSSDIKYTFYSRLRPNATRFEEQRDLSQNVWGFDGGCTIAADFEGNVYAFFAGTTEAGNETVRHVYLARSTDNGTSFATPKPIDLGKGVCACCHLKADLDAKGALHLVYRVAESSVQRDSFVLTSLDQGRSFTPTPLDNWKLRACPGSAYSFAKTATETFVSWRTENEIYLTGLTTNRPFSPPGKVQKRRAAILGNNLKGEVLVTWSEGENFNKPHDLKWQLYDGAGQAIGDVGTLENAFKRWGNSAVFADSEGNFTILY